MNLQLILEKVKNKMKELTFSKKSGELTFNENITKDKDVETNSGSVYKNSASWAKTTTRIAAIRVINGW